MKKLPAVFTVLFCVFCLCLVYSVSVQSDLRLNLLRLHVVANSNSAKDQGIKLAVRDKMLETARRHGRDLCEMQEVAKEFLDEIDAGYGVKVLETVSHVPAKSYKGIALPNGEYNCVKVILGDGAGENWWCVAYPPLCYTESMFGSLSEDGMDELASILNEETMRTIVQAGRVNIRFKIVDTFQYMVKKSLIAN